MIDQQSALFFLLGWPIFPLDGKWGDFVDYSEFVESMLIFFYYSKSWQMEMMTDGNQERYKSWQMEILRDGNHDR